MKGTLDKQLEDPEYRRVYEIVGSIMRIEDTIYKEIQEQEFTYVELADKIGMTQRKIVAAVGGPGKPRLRDVAELAHTLGMELVLVKKEAEK